MIKIYPAIFHQEEGSYWVEFPDLQGCLTSGQTLEESLQMAIEALGLYLIALEEDGITPSPASDIRDVIHPAGSFVSLVFTNPDKYRRNTKAVKKTLSIPEWLNEEAEKHHINFSSVLQTALKERLHITE